MGQMYSASFSAVAVTAVQDLFELLTPATGIAKIHEVRISQITKTTSEMLRLTIQRNSGSGSAGSTPTKYPLEVGGAAAECTIEANNTSRGAGATVLVNMMWNVVNGEYVYLPIPEDRIVVSPSSYVTVGLETAPAASMTMSGTIIWEEVGGA
jgi:hypothetical protein